MGGLPAGILLRPGDGDGRRLAVPDSDGDPVGVAVFCLSGDWSCVGPGAVVAVELVTAVVEVVTAGVACGSWRTVADMMVGAGPPEAPRLVGGGSSLAFAVGEVERLGGCGVGLAVPGPGGRSWEAVGSCIAIS